MILTYLEILIPLNSHPRKSYPLEGMGDDAIHQRANGRGQSLDGEKARGYVSGIKSLKHVQMLKIALHSSDADPEILSDYTLALFDSDVTDEEIRKSAIENLEDFLKSRKTLLGL